MNNHLIEDISKTGESTLQLNIQPDEKILVKIRGRYGEALVLTDKRIYIIKWGFMTGYAGDGMCNVFDYRNVIGIEMAGRGFLTGLGAIEVLTSATRNSNVSGLALNVVALKSPYMVAFTGGQAKRFQEAVQLARGLINAHHASPISSENNLSNLERLAELKVKGIITDEEFTAKKKSLLGL